MRQAIMSSISKMSLPTCWTKIKYHTKYMNSKYCTPYVSKLILENSHTARAFSHSQRICPLYFIPNPQASHTFCISLLLWEVYFGTLSRQKTSPYSACSSSKFFSRIFYVSPFEGSPTPLFIASSKAI